ncbi:MAG: hypothetical protein RMJ66_08765 [Bacteroidia bacterium]|nr:hypothetical protein [Bacteroidia bacterium]MDW8135139.1 hypothetical protein [Bacteroidia bacterium]
MMINFKPNVSRGTLVLGGEPHVVHCHFYNHFFQTSIEDAARYYPVEEVLVWTAQEIGHSLFRELFQELGASDIGHRKAVVESVFARCGYGRVSLEGVSAEGGKVNTPYEHYAYTYAATFPPRAPGQRGVSYFSQGYLAGALEAIYDLSLGSMGSRQTACLSLGDRVVEWEFFRLGTPLPLFFSPQEGRYEEGTIHQPSHTRVPIAQIRDAVLGLPLLPDETTGLIEAFGVVLTFTPANYYGLVSDRHVARIEKAVGSEIRPVVLNMLIESGHVCAFNTVGSILQSAEWDAVVRPYLDSSEDWFYGLAGCFPAIGWGLVEYLDRPNSEGGRVKFINWYETTAIAASSYVLDHPPAARGLLSGIWALIYTADIPHQRITLDGTTYRKFFFHKRKPYEAYFIHSRLGGAPEDLLRIQVPPLLD